MRATATCGGVLLEGAGGGGAGSAQVGDAGFGNTKWVVRIPQAQRPSMFRTTEKITNILMAIEIRKVERVELKLRLGLAGAAGSGKTMSALICSLLSKGRFN